MSCKKYAGMISDYVDDALPITQRREIEAHLAECCVCAAEAEATKRLVSRLSSLSCSETPVDCWAGVRDKLVCRRSSWWGWIVRPAFAAPAVALVAVLAVLLVWPGGGPARSPQASPRPAEYASYISAHLHVQRMQAFNDPNVPFIAAELEKASVSGNSEGQ